MSVLGTDPLQPVRDAIYVPAVERAEAVSAIQAAASTNPVASPESDQSYRPEDYYELTETARELARQAYQEILARRRARDDEAARQLTDAELLAAINNRAVRELVASFAGYDNSAAVRAYDNSLNLYAAYGSSAANSVATGEAALRRASDRDLERLGVSHVIEATRETREGVSRAIDRWFVGEAVFFPQMLRYSSSDGFRFSPVSERAMASRGAAAVMADYDQSRIVAYLRELAGLTPNDFLFYDPTGLGDLELRRRRELLALIDQLFVLAEIDARAADMRYEIANADALNLELLRTQEAELAQRLRDAEANAGGDYFRILQESVRQYGLEILSESLY